MISSRLTLLPLVSLLLVAGNLWAADVMPSDTPPALPGLPDTPEDPAQQETANADTDDSATEPTPEPDPLDAEAYQQALADLARQEERAGQLEESSGQNAYNAELTEAYLAIGATLRKLERYEESLAAYDKALQAARISFGLNSLQQIPILDQMRQSYQDMADWEGVDTNIHLVYHIAIKNFPVGDQSRVNALMNLGQWKLKAAREELLDSFRNNASETYTLYKSELRQLKKAGDYDDKDLHLATLYLGEAASAYALAKQTYERPLRDYQTGSQRTVQQRQCFPVRLADGRVITVCQMIEVPDINYYVDPSNRKNSDIGRYLKDMKESILLAYQALQNPETNPEQRDALLIEVQRLTVQYNQFVSDSSSQAPGRMTK